MEADARAPMAPLSEGLFRAIFDAAPDALLVVTQDGRIAIANGPACKLFGYAQGELTGQLIEVLVAESQRVAHAGLRTAFSTAPRARPMGSGLLLHGRKKHGELVPVEIMLSAVGSSGVSYVCAAVRDVSERNRTARELGIANEILHSAVESYQGAFAVFDSDDRLVLCNSACRVMFGLAISGPLIGRSYAEIVSANISSHRFNAESAETLAARWLAYHAHPEGSLELHTVEGRRLRLIERRTESGGTVSTAWDMTADMRREDELRTARATAEKANRAKTEFLASMSHELRTPLNAVLGFTQLLQRDKIEPLTERQQQRLTHVVRGGEHLLRLIDEVLDLSRIEAGRITISMEPVVIADVLADVRTTLEPIAAHAGIALHVPEDASTYLVVQADRTRLIQILLNYGSNAVKYGRPGGHVSFQVASHHDRVRIDVSDNGIGIADRYREHVWEPFGRAGQQTGPIEGTGIGLAICKRLSILMGGTVGFQSEEGSGSTFWVELPQPAEHTAARTAATLASKQALARLSKPGCTIVYVEDNPSNLAFMEAFAQDLGNIELIAASTAEIGLDIIRSHLPDVVLMDLNLPGMSGFDATRLLRESPLTAHIPVVAVSAAAMPRDRERAKEVGFYRYLTKPVNVDELTATLEELLQAARDRKG